MFSKPKEHTGIDDEKDITAAEMASLMASMLGGVTGEKPHATSSSTSGASKAKGGKTKDKTRQDKSRTGGGGEGATLSARLGISEPPAKPESTERRGSRADDAGDCFLSVGDKVLVLNK